MSGKLLIAGLGNPGDKYNGTRHSIGFAVIDKFADKFGASFNSDKNVQVQKFSPMTRR